MPRSHFNKDLCTPISAVFFKTVLLVLVVVFFTNIFWLSRKYKPSKVAAAVKVAVRGDLGVSPMWPD